MAGKPPSPRAGCAAALSGHRLYLYGGESDATGPPLDDLCCLDLEGASWQQLIGRGMSPGRLSFAAAASIGNKVYLFGGCTGEGVTNSFHSLDVVSTMWDPIESLTSQPPSPRMGHSMVAVCSQLLVYGGKDKATGKVFAGLAVFDTQGEHWSTLQARPHPVSDVTCYLALARSPPPRQATGARRQPAQVVTKWVQRPTCARLPTYRCAATSPASDGATRASCGAGSSCWGSAATRGRRTTQ